jgi:hypothetical protein
LDWAAGCIEPAVFANEAYHSSALMALVMYVATLNDCRCHWPVAVLKSFGSC